MQKIESMIRQWADERGLIEGTTTEKQCLKLQSEVGELSDALLKGDHYGVVDGLGDCFVVMVNMCAGMGISLEGCALAAYSEIKNRKGRMVNGTFVKEES